MIATINVHQIGQYNDGIHLKHNIYPSRPRKIPSRINGNDGTTISTTCDEMRAEKMYDLATWRMYHRITNARRQQLLNNPNDLNSSLSRYPDAKVTNNQNYNYQNSAQQDLNLHSLQDSFVDDNKSIEDSDEIFVLDMES